MVDGEAVACLDAFGTDDLPINPDYHAIHPSPLDCSDVLALRAFGLA